MKIRLLRISTLVLLLVTAKGVQADLVITGILDGTFSGGNPRAFELYTTEAIPNFEAVYQFQYASNTNSYNNVSTSFGAIPANSYFYITKDIPALTSVFGTGLIAHQNGSVDTNGDDSGRIILKSDSSVIDEAYTNSTASDAFRNSYMYRIDFTGPDSSYDAANWSFGGNDLLNSPNNTASQMAALVPFGTYQAAAVVIPEPSAFFLGTLICGVLGWTSARKRDRS